MATCSRPEGHCWHAPRAFYSIAVGVEETCCWCGERRRQHGPHAPHGDLSARFEADNEWNRRAHEEAIGKAFLDVEAERWHAGEAKWRQG